MRGTTQQTGDGHLLAGGLFATGAPWAPPLELIRLQFELHFTRVRFNCTFSKQQFLATAEHSVR